MVAGIQAHFLQQAMCGEVAGGTKWMLAGKVYKRLPYRQILLIQLLTSEFNGDIFGAGKDDPIKELPVLALNSSEESGTQKAVRRSAFGLVPQRKLNNIGGLASFDLTAWSLKRFLRMFGYFGLWRYCAGQVEAGKQLPCPSGFLLAHLCLVPVRPFC